MAGVFKSVKLSEETYDEIIELQGVLHRRGTMALPEKCRPDRPSFDGIVKAAVKAMRLQVRAA
jgi:hypothetical protein